MSDEEITEFVEATRSELEERYADKADSFESFGEFLGFNSTRATRVGLGLLHLGDVEAVRDWFDPLSSGWLDVARGRREAILDGDDSPDASELPWREWKKGLWTAVLSGDLDRQRTVAMTVLDEIDDPMVDQLPGRNRTPGLDLVAALAALVVEQDSINDHVASLRSREFDHSSSDAYMNRLADAIERIDSRDAAGVRNAVEEMLAVHESDDDSASHVVERSVDLDACTFVVLARQRGLDVRVGSEIVPESVYELA